MQLQQIEKKLARIAERRTKLQYELANMQTPKLDRNIRLTETSEWWYRDKPLTNVEIVPGGLRAEIPVSDHIYLSYKESNVDFSVPPDHYDNSKGRNHYFRFFGETTGDVSAALYVIGYREQLKTWIKKIPLGTEQKIELENQESIRVALRIQGTGSLSIKELRMDDTTVPFVSEAGACTDQEQSAGLSKKEMEDSIYFPAAEMFVEPIDQKYTVIDERMIHIDLPEERYLTLSLGEADRDVFINAKSLYNIYFQSQASGNLEQELIIAGYADGRPIDMKCVKERTSEKIKLAEDVSHVRFFMRVKGKGAIIETFIQLEEEPITPIDITELELNEHHWFAPPSSHTKFTNQEHGIALVSGVPHGDTKYVSYQIKNISFKLIPETSAFKISEDSYYEVEIGADTSGTGTAVPIFVTYSEEGKKEILPLEFNEKNIIKFKSEIRACRIAFKLSGSNKVILTHFTIKQFKDVKTGGSMVWRDEKEVQKFGMVPKKDLKKVKMAVIFDEFTTECFAHECNLITFTPDNWKQVLSADVPDLLMVESAWRGNGGAWTKKVQFTSEEAIDELKELIKWCNEKRIPTVFWNKEDPVHFNHFVKTAELFDYIFTTDANSIPSYKEACGHDRVDCLPFAAQPKIHNPLTIGRREEAASFAGSYYAKHIERSESMMRIFNEAIPYGLAIYDRNFEKVQKGLLKNNRFPDHIQPFIKGSLKYYEIDKSYKGYKVMINVNTVKNSPTMFARRVYEGLASGTPIISTHSDGVKALFGDLICVSENEEEIREAFKTLFENPGEYRRIAQAGITRVLEHHTYQHRLEKIIDTLNLPFVRKNLEILVYSIAADKKEAESIIENYNRQNWQHKRLCLLCAEEDMELPAIRDDSIQVWNLHDYLKQYPNLLMETGMDYVTFFSPEENYNEDFLLNLSLTATYAPWEIIGEYEGRELYYGQVPFILSMRGIFKKELFSAMSSMEALDSIQSNATGLFTARGARTMGIPNM